MSSYFLDSNVLIYAYSPGDVRTERALELIENGGAVSVQCLNEFVSVSHRKLRMSWDRIDEAVSLLIRLCEPVIPIDVELHRKGVAIARRYKTSIYDGLIVAAALVAGCETLYSEDMHAGLVVDGRLTIVNPFAA